MRDAHDVTGRITVIEHMTLEQVVEFHGHMCPGLAMGVQAAQLALREIGPHVTDEEVVAVVETDMCGVDAIQFLTGCTFGKGNLVHRDWGKNAYSFFRRSDGRAVRIVARAGAWQRDPEHQALFAKVRAGQADAQERARFQELHQAQSSTLLAMEPDELFAVQELDGPPPRKARILESVDCAECGEATMETRVRRLDGRELCTPCFDAALSGERRVAPPAGLRSSS
jgi:formylmethanofuran dehydrogenase subunit E